MKPVLNKDKYPKQCLFCGALLNGRTDKKFCDDDCRNNYYYQNNNQQKSYIKNINNILNHNRNILQTLNHGIKTIVRKQDLVEKQFDFEKFTGIYHTKKGKKYHIIYDHAYSFLNEDSIMLIKYKDNK